MGWVGGGATVARARGSAVGQALDRATLHRAAAVHCTAALTVRRSQKHDFLFYESFESESALFVYIAAPGVSMRTLL